MDGGGTKQVMTTSQMTLGPMQVWGGFPGGWGKGKGHPGDEENLLRQSHKLPLMTLQTLLLACD